MADRRYSTAAWQRLRLQVLACYGHICQLQGANCLGRANTVHHIEPSSQRPDLFWEPTNLTASCSRCNYADGSRVAAVNRRAASERIMELEQQNQRLEEIVTRQQERIEELAMALVEARERPAAKPARKWTRPAIH